MRARTSGSAGSRWKKDCPKSPRTILPTKRTNCTGRGSLKPMDSRSTARSDSGASGIMSATGSPLTWRIANVTRDTPTQHHHEADDPANEQGQHGAPARGRRRPANRAAGFASKSQSHSSGRAAYCDLLRDAEGVVLGPQEDAGRLLADHLLDLRVDALALGLVHARARLVDELVQPLHARVPLAVPAARLGVVEGCSTASASKTE